MNGETGIGMIEAERIRQVLREGFTPQHDDEHDDGALGKAALVYIGTSIIPEYSELFLKFWPFHRGWFKPKDRKRNLVKAGALIAAELDRLIRLENDLQEKESKAKGETP